MKEGAASLMPAIAASPRAMPAPRVRHRGSFCERFMWIMNDCELRNEKGHMRFGSLVDKVTAPLLEDWREPL